MIIQVQDIKTKVIQDMKNRSHEELNEKIPLVIDVISLFNLIINEDYVRNGHSINYFLNTIKKVMTFP